MSVRAGEQGAVVLEGRCGVAEAEDLLRMLLESPAQIVDWRACEEAHTAIIQVLLQLRPRLRGPCRNQFLEQWIGPILSASQ